MTEAITATTTDHFAEAQVVAAARERGEPDWLVERRGEGARAFAATPTPTPALRPWKYTDVTGLDVEAFGRAALPVTVTGATPAGAYAGTIVGAFDIHADPARRHLGELVTTTEGKFVAANAAMWDSGAFVYVPRGVAFDGPVVIEFDAGDAAQASVFPRLLVVVEERGEVAIVVRQRSGGGPLLAMGVIEVLAGPASRVKLLLDGRWGEQTQEFTTVRSRLERDADVNVSSIAIGGHIVKQTIEALIEGEGANSVIRGVALGDGDQHFDFVTLQDHMGARTTSDVQIKAALAGASKSVYYGVTRVEETAAGSQANQQNRNLLLSKHAKADSDPVLEILTADVIRCGHGATVGPVDQEAMFYLQSRGLDRRTALQLLVSGFFRTVVDAIDVEGAGEQLDESVFAKLATAEL